MLEQILKKHLARHGPMDLATYMTYCLQHPEFGYYKTREAIGDLRQDFITAPELSSLFGEIVGAWLTHEFKTLHDPDTLTHIIELGPGKGTLMKDVLSVFTQHYPDVPLQITFLEINPLLKAAQSEMMQTHFPHITFEHIEDISQLPQGQLLCFANEFFDALPIRAFEKYQGNFCEQIVMADDDSLKLTLNPQQNALSFSLNQIYRDTKDGDIIEHSPAVEHCMTELCHHLSNNTGSVFICDYGYESPPLTSTLRAIKSHQFVDIFHQPGKSDLSAFVNFEHLKTIANQHGLKTSDILTQAEFLTQNGALERLKNAQSSSTDLLLNAQHMGGVFKTLTFSTGV